MKLKHLSFTLFATCGLLTGCLSEPEFAPQEEGNGIPINFDGSIRQVATRVNAQGFEDKDAIALYAVNYENSNQTPGILKDEGNQADHVKYIFDQTNWKWNPVRPVYYKDVNTNVDLYAFYPYAEPASVSEYNFEVQKDQSTEGTDSKLAGYEASDFLWGKAANISPTEATIQMTLNHMMAGAHVILNEGTGFEQAGDFALIEKKILLTNTTRKSTINLADGTVTPVGGPQATGIVMCPQSDGTHRAIVVPQIVDPGTQLFSITIEGMSYSFALDVPVKYIAGKLSTFNITINRKQPTGEYELVLADNQIVDWTEDINVHQGTARQYYCVHVTEPGTLGRLIKADKKNPMKIKNLKVSGTISDEDFYFMRDSMAILEAVNLKESRVVDVKCSKLTLYGHNDEYGKSTVFATREAGTYDDVIPDNAFKGKISLYHFTFPERITQIGENAFSASSLSGALVLPDDIVYLWNNSFANTNISSLTTSSNIKIIGNSVFENCGSLTGELALPEILTYIGANTFTGCSFKGYLNLPENLEYIGEYAFAESGDFIGDLKIPSRINQLYKNTFWSNKRNQFNGQLFLNNVTKLAECCFSGCGFQGELVIPEGVTEIPEAFIGPLGGWTAGGVVPITGLKLPSTLKIIRKRAFCNCTRLTGELHIPEGVVIIGTEAFNRTSITSLYLPSTLQTIQDDAFNSAYDIVSIVSMAVQPPTVLSRAFDGVPKDNFTLEVPYDAVNRYSTDPMWGQFKRISAHYDFSISRRLARVLNGETSKKYILRAPANHNWSIQDKPEWITVTPSSGTGKTEVTVTFAEMTATEASQISVEMTHPTYAYQTTTKSLKGRAGEIVFSLDGKDYTTSMTVEQFDYQYGDGDVITLNEATKGNGVDIVFLGDCYDAADIAAGNYMADLQEAMGYYFNIEPYKTYKEYFNVYAVVGVSDDSGMGTLNTIKDAKFGSTFGEKNLVQPNMNECFKYACKAPINDNIAQTLIVLVENTTEYGGVCYMYGDGSAVACCPKSADAYPYDFRGIVQHEAGGHGFGKLADEYIYHNAFISTCTCTCCSHGDELLAYKNRGWYRNIELTGNMNEVGWSHFIFHPKYSNVVDIYEGGYFHTRGVYRSEPTSCMNNNVPYFSAISRQAMVERIMEYAGETFNLETFIEKDVTTASTAMRSTIADVEMPVYTNGKQHAPVYMGDKPDFKN